MVLDHVPAATTTLTIIGPNDNTDVTAEPATLTFTTSNWNVPRTVTISASEDDDATVEPATSITHSLSGGRYDEVTVPDVTVTVSENDTVGIVLSEAEVTVVEGSATGTSYTVKLGTQPSGEVTVTVSGHENTDLTLRGLSSTSTLEFTTGSWSTPQTVTVTTADDPDAADEEATLTHAASGGDYDNVSKTLPVVIDDKDIPVLVVSREEMALNEGDTTGQAFTVRLPHVPTEDVTITISGHSGTDLLLAGVSASSTLTFTASNWDTPQTVTVTAGNDADAGNDDATLTLTGAGGEYAGVTAELEVTVDDDETPDLVLDRTSLNVTEGSAAGYTVRLLYVPTGNVTVNISGHANTDLSLSTTTLTFTASDWNTEQTVTVTAGEDEDAAADMARLVNIASGGEYEGVSRDLAVTVDENDEPEIVLSTTALTVEEGPASSTSYTIRLSHRPTENVNVRVSGFAAAGLAMEVTSFHFTPADWNTPQTTTATAPHDADAVNERATLVHTARGGEYQGVTKELPVTVEDDEETDVLVSRTELSVEEGNATGTTYTVRLTSEPTGTVTVDITGHSDTDLRLSTTTLTFTAFNWNEAQTVSVTAGDDPDAADDPATLTHTASGGDYGDVTTELHVTVDDDETASLVVTPTEVGVIEQSATGTSYTVKLSHVPIATTTVTVEGHAGTDLTLSGPIDDTLTFTPDNWDTAQTVTVTATHDDDAVDDPATLTHTARGGAYQDLTKTVTVTVDDDEETRVELSVESLGPIDEGAVQSYTVRLSSEPTAATTVEITGHEDASVALDRMSLTFTKSNWNIEQTVNVTSTQDDDAVDDEITLTHTANGGDYQDVSTDLTVTVTDDEETNVLVSRAELSVEEGNATGTSYTVRVL